jgi:hypothetical protein
MRTLGLMGVLVLAAGAASGCASGSVGSGGLAPTGGVTTQTMVSGPGGGVTAMNMVDDAAASGSRINGTAAAAWPALQSVYASLEIPLSFRDEGKKTLGNTAFRARRRVGPVPMIRAVDCGGESGMPNAETYDVTLSVSSMLTAMPDGTTRLQTLVQGTARRPSSGAVNDVRCTSLGGLEQRISDMVNAILAGK